MWIMTLSMLDQSSYFCDYQGLLVTKVDPYPRDSDSVALGECPRFHDVPRRFRSGEHCKKNWISMFSFKFRRILKLWSIISWQYAALN
jgi:hypothetical protein